MLPIRVVLNQCWAPDTKYPDILRHHIIFGGWEVDWLPDRLIDQLLNILMN